MKYYNVKDIISINQISSDFFKAGRGDSFTKAGLKIIFDHLEEIYDDGLIEYDVIGICSEFSEYDDLESLISDYESDLDKDQIYDEDGEIDEYELLSQLQDITFAESTGFSIVIRNY